MRGGRHLLLALFLASLLALSSPSAHAFDVLVPSGSEPALPAWGPLQLTLGGEDRPVTGAPVSLWEGSQPLGLGALGDVLGQRAQRSLGTPVSSSIPSGRTSSYSRLGWGSGPLRLQAQIVDARSQFTLPREEPGDDGEAKLLRDALGTRDLQFNADWSLGAASALTSSYRSVRNDKPGDQSQGLTTTDIGNALAFALGGGSQLKATLQEHKESWAFALGNSDERRRTRAVELTSQFGGGGIGQLKLAATNLETTKGETQTSQSVREVHLSVAPAGRLRLTADHVTQSAGGQPGSTAQTAAAVLQLAPDAEVAATLTANTDGTGSRTRQADLKLTAALGGGATSGKLAGERTSVRPPDGQPPRRVTKWDLSGGLGTGASRTNLTASMHEERMEGSDGTLARAEVVHVDRALGPHLQLSADRAQKLVGTNQSPQTSWQSTYALKADLGARTKVMTRLESWTSDPGGERSAQHVTLEHTLAAVRLLLDAQRDYSGTDASSSDACTIDMPRGEVAEWAQVIGQTHQFPDAAEYLMASKPAELDMPFAGTRVRTRTLRGGPDSGMNVLEVAHRQMLGGRYHLLAAYQEHPEARDGDRKGRPMPFRRHLVEIGARIHGGLVAHGRYVADESTSVPLSHRHDISVGLRGRLSDRDELEAAISRETGDWDDRASARTRISVMYALHVSDEHQVSLKGSCGWGGSSSSDSDPKGHERRLSLGYSKAI